MRSLWLEPCFSGCARCRLDARRKAGPPGRCKGGSPAREPGGPQANMVGATGALRPCTTKKPPCRRRCRICSKSWRGGSTGRQPEPSPVASSRAPFTSSSSWWSSSPGRHRRLGTGTSRPTERTHCHLVHAPRGHIPLRKTAQGGEPLLTVRTWRCARSARCTPGCPKFGGHAAQSWPTGCRCLGLIGPCPFSWVARVAARVGRFLGLLLFLWGETSPNVRPARVPMAMRQADCNQKLRLVQLLRPLGARAHRPLSRIVGVSRPTWRPPPHPGRSACSSAPIPFPPPRGAHRPRPSRRRTTGLRASPLSSPPAAQVRRPKASACVFMPQPSTSSAPKSSLTGNSRRWPPRRRLLYSLIWSAHCGKSLGRRPRRRAPPSEAATLPTAAGALIKWSDLVAQSGAGPELDAYLQARNINRTATLALMGVNLEQFKKAVVTPWASGYTDASGHTHKPRIRLTPPSARRSCSICGSRRAASGRRATPPSTPPHWPSRLRRLPAPSRWPPPPWAAAPRTSRPRTCREFPVKELLGAEEVLARLWHEHTKSKMYGTHLGRDPLPPHLGGRRRAQRAGPQAPHRPVVLRLKGCGR